MGFLAPLRGAVNDYDFAGGLRGLRPPATFFATLRVVTPERTAKRMSILKGCKNFFPHPGGVRLRTLPIRRSALLCDLRLLSFTPAGCCLITHLHNLTGGESRGLFYYAAANN